MKDLKNIKRWAIAVMGCSICFIHTSKTNVIEAAEGLGGPPHIGTFEGSTTFMTTSRNGINPGLYLEVMDAEGNYTEYTSEEGIITISNTKEGAYVTQAKLLGITKYKDQQTGEILDGWEEGRDLALVSSEGPGLTTVGKNLFNEEFVQGYLSDSTGIVANGKEGISSKDFIKVEGNTQYTLSLSSNPKNGSVSFYYYDNNLSYIGRKSSVTNCITPANAAYLKFRLFHSDGINIEDYQEVDVQLEKSSTPTSYEPYQSNRLTVHEDVTLRGVGDARDTLDLITGEIVERVGELAITEDTPNKGLRVADNGMVQINIPMSVFDTGNGTTSKDNIRCDKFMWSEANILNPQEGLRINGNTLHWAISINKLTSPDLIGVNNYLSNNSITVQYQLAEETYKKVTLNSTYYFDPVLNREVRVNGTVLPLVASVTIPTEPLSFLLDPNQEEGEQFIAPEFSITNNTPTSIYLNLKSFEQATDAFNDVLPTTHSDWNQLDKQQSKDIALALVPIPSEGWLSLDEGPRYVADTSNYVLGEVKKRSTVDFTFSALHGQSFIEELNPKYRLAFEFGFKN